MAEKVTIMVLKVDLQCSDCYRKVKKVLCKFPQIKDQVYDEKNNTVTITVVCCSPEKIRDKLCCKGGKAIKSIEIKQPPKPKPPEKPKEPEKPKVPEKPKEPEKPKVLEKPKEPEKPKAPEKPKVPEKPKEPEKPKAPEKPKEPEKPKAPEKPKEVPKPSPPKPSAPAPKPPESKPAPPPAPAPAPVAPPPQPVIPACPPVHVFPTGICCTPCYEGIPRGPCYHGFGMPVTPPPPAYDFYGCKCGCGGHSYGGGCRCDYYFSDENPSACTVM